MAAAIARSRPAERRAREPQRSEKDEAVVERQGKAGQARGRVEKHRCARAVREARDKKPEEDAALPGPPPEGPDRRQRKEHRPRVSERHPGAVLPLLLHRAPSVDPVRERQDRG